MKIGSLFDGSGGFPLAASLCGIKPVWASEIEPYPIAVTRSRFPEMIHLGDVSKVNGAEIEPVYVITFGSPCQDLSVAGRRAGLKHTENGDEETTRSGLFMEAIRIIKEMREATHGKYPRFAVWENVPGAFSSNKGEDFRIVLEELIKIVEPTAEMPSVPGGKWPYADCYVGTGWSIAYRTFDAQYWGVPQRRRRIYLVADFRTECAGEILFEREGLRGYFAPVEEARQGASRDVGNGVETADCDGAVKPVCFGIGGFNSEGMLSSNPYAGIYEAKTSRTLDLNGGNPACNQGGICIVEAVKAAGFKANQGPKAGNIGWQEECACTLSANRPGLEPSVCIKERYLFENHSQDSRYKGPLEVCPMLPAQLGTGGNNQPFVVEQTRVYESHPQDSRIKEIKDDISPTVSVKWHKGTADTPIICMAHGQANAEILENMSPCLNCNHEQPIVFDKEVYQSGENATGGHYIAEGGPAPTLRTTGHPPGVCVRYIVRRLTPTECARLQGFADRWGDIEQKEDFTDEEYRFWLNVRNTHAAINGKAVKDYTKKQMLTWYNKLATDSAEYKMWGNGIALPCALYVMQGIQDALEVDNGSVA